MFKGIGFFKTMIISIFSVSLITGCDVFNDAYHSNHVHDYTSKVIQPTCKEGGYTIYTCSTCGDSYTGNVTAKVGHTENSKTCKWCGMHYWSETVKLVKNKGTYNSSKKVYQMSYPASNYVTYLQYETSNNTLWLINAYNKSGVMALDVPEVGWECFFAYVVGQYEFYCADMNSYSNFIVGRINTQDIKYSNRTSLLPLTGSNIVSSLKNAANQACHEQMFVACSSLFLILANNKCEFSNPHLGFINWEH